ACGELHKASVAVAEASPPDHRPQSAFGQPLRSVDAADIRYFYPAGPSRDADRQNSAPDPAHTPSQKTPHPSRPKSISPPPASTDTTTPPSHPLPHQTPCKTHPRSKSSPSRYNPKSPAPPPHIVITSSAQSPP